MRLFRRSKGGTLLLCTAVLLVSVALAKASGRQIVLVAYGDSLTAGLFLPPSKAFPARLQAALRAKGHKVQIINAGVSGDTASSGLARLAWSLPKKADGVIVELGANDALRAIDPAHTRKSLDKILARLKSRGLEILLAGMLAPPNFGKDYEASFNGIYDRLAKKHEVLLYPFFLKGTAADPALNFPDGLHPNAKGVEIIVTGILPHVEKLIARIRARLAKGD